MLVVKNLFSFWSIEKIAPEVHGSPSVRSDGALYSQSNDEILDRKLSKFFCCIILNKLSLKLNGICEILMCFVVLSFLTRDFQLYFDKM